MYDPKLTDEENREKLAKEIKEAEKNATSLNYNFMTKMTLNDGRIEPHTGYFHSLKDAQKYALNMRKAHNMDKSPNCGIGIYDKNGNPVY